jgi:pimeloyl-ACP methyl ester carboxylesterase
MKNIWMLLVLMIVAQSCLNSQNIERISMGDDPALHYLAVPPADSAVGALILLPGFGQLSNSIFPETKLHNVAYTNQLLVVAIHYGQKMYVDKPTEKWLNTCIEDMLQRYQINPDKVVIGGFSAGGTIALRYTELSRQYPDRFPIQPAAVFAIDSPVDLFDIWSYCEREIEKDFSAVGMAEAKFLIEFLSKDLGGTPSDKPQKYAQATPFQRNIASGMGNEQYLMSVPVRTYHDIDINWLLQNRRRDLFDTNAAPASAMINRLILNGHESAEMIISEKPGVRSNGQRHPHSWSIVDEVECVFWILDQLN